jgi:hypothetical protein
MNTRSAPLSAGSCSVSPRRAPWAAPALAACRPALAAFRPAVAALRPALLGLAGVLLAGCPPRVVTPPGPVPEVDPVALLARAESLPPPAPAAATFGLHVETPDKRVSASGALVVQPPDHFRVEVRGPIGPPVLVIVSDGTGLYAWEAGKNVFHTAADADAALRQETGGAAGLGALTSLLIGRLPALRKPDAIGAMGVPEYRWAGAGQSALSVALDPRSARLAGLALFDEAGAAVLQASVTAPDLPEHLEVRMPAMGLVARLDFDGWKPAAPPPSAFVLPAPAGAEVRPLDLHRKVPVGGEPDGAAAPAQPSPTGPASGQPAPSP